MATEQISTSIIADDAVTTAKVADDAITGALIENNPTIAGNLTVSGTSTLTGNSTVGGTLGVTGNVTASGNLTVNGNTTLGNATSDTVTIAGNLTVNGTQTTINTATLDVEDKNIEIAKVSSPSDTTAADAGITIKGATDKTLQWKSATNSLSSNVKLAENAGSSAYHRPLTTSLALGL